MSTPPAPLATPPGGASLSCRSAVCSLQRTVSRGGARRGRGAEPRAENLQQRRRPLRVSSPPRRPTEASDSRVSPAAASTPSGTPYRPARRRSLRTVTISRRDDDISSRRRYPGATTISPRGDDIPARRRYLLAVTISRRDDDIPTHGHHIVLPHPWRHGFRQPQGPVDRSSGTADRPPLERGDGSWSKTRTCIHDLVRSLCAGPHGWSRAVRETATEQGPNPIALQQLLGAPLLGVPAGHR